MTRAKWAALALSGVGLILGQVGWSLIRHIPAAVTCERAYFTLAGYAIGAWRMRVIG